MVKKAVIIGFGSLGFGSWYKAIKKHPDWELIGIVDTDTELLENVPSTIGLDEDQAYVSIDDAVAYGEKPDLAIISTPIYTHHVLTKETMDHGINVICEKNMASTIYQGKQMVQLAIDNPHLCTAVGTQYRYFPKFWTAKQFFRQEDNPIGDIAFIKWESAGNWGESRRGWRRWLSEIYLEDMSTHWFDLLMYITGKDIVQVRADTFIPKYSEWQGSSTVFVNLALADKDDYYHRHNWIWVQLYGDWQKRGISYDKFQFFCEKGDAEIDEWGLKLRIYQDKEGKKWEEDGFLIMDAGPIANIDKNYRGQEVILEMMARGIESNGKQQPETNFKEAFKSFAVSMAAIESSRTGKAVWVPDYWKNFLDEE